MMSTDPYITVDWMLPLVLEAEVLAIGKDSPIFGLIMLLLNAITVQLSVSVE